MPESSPADAQHARETTPKVVTPRQMIMLMALGTIISVSTIVAAIYVLAACVVLVHAAEMTSSLALRTVVCVAVAGTLAQISLLSFLFVWEKYRQRRTVAQHSNRADESRADIFS